MMSMLFGSHGGLDYPRDIRAGELPLVCVRAGMFDRREKEWRSHPKGKGVECCLYL